MSDERSAGGRTYRRRRPLPALALLVLLAVVVTTIWMRVLGSQAQLTGAIGCPPPAATPPAVAPPAAAPPAAPGPTAAPGTPVARTALAAATPAAPIDVAVQVLNANGVRGQASLVSAELVQLGFTAAKNPAGNDTVYADQNMQCVGQIRFGAAGLAQARTLQLVVPCAELVQDARTDPGLDLALGTTFGQLAPGGATTTVLTALNDAKKSQTPPVVDKATLDAATNTRC
jgi:hypothetical protein